LQAAEGSDTVSFFHTVSETQLQLFSGDTFHSKSSCFFREEFHCFFSALLVKQILDMQADD